MGVRHVAVFTWKDGTTAVDVDAFAEALATLPDSIPEIRALRYGADLGLVEGNDTFAVVADFDDVADYRRYAEDAGHRHLIDTRLRPMLATRHALQFEI
jgi:hypothetical protein